jgi:hypothetical protein
MAVRSSLVEAPTWMKRISFESAEATRDVAPRRVNANTEVENVMRYLPEKYLTTIEIPPEFNSSFVGHKDRENFSMTRTLS